MSSSSASAWPTPDGAAAPLTPSDNIWKTVKTEEEEYLEKLQSKLSRIMQNGNIPTEMNGGNVDVDPDDLPDDTYNVQQRDDDDPGLHLLYQFPHRSPSPSPSTHSEPAPVAAPAQRPRLVRFRSRVRITSGVRVPTSGSSSTCESVSSSISAPLRGFRHEINVKSATLNGIPSAGKAGPWISGLRYSLGGNLRRPRETNAVADERSPLTSASNSPGSVYTESEEGDDREYERMQAAARKSEEEVMFGRWPWRILNTHWWRWKLEPIFCCCAQFDDESDDD